MFVFLLGVGWGNGGREKTGSRARDFGREKKKEEKNSSSGGDINRRLKIHAWGISKFTTHVNTVVRRTTVCERVCPYLEGYVCTKMCVFVYKSPYLFVCVCE